MKYLIKNKKIIIFLLILQSCVFAKLSQKESYYKILKIDKERNRSEIEVTPDRVIAVCESVTEEFPNLRGFQFFVLDDKNTVISIIRTNTIDKSVCNREIAKINIILKNGKKIYFGGMGDALDSHVKEGNEYFFKNHGKFKSNSRVLQWMVISNERSECFAAYRADEKPCPTGEFPIGKNE